MHGVLRAHGKRYWIAPRAVAKDKDARRLLFRDARAALLFLRELVAADREGYSRVRRLLVERRMPSLLVRLDDDAVLHALAARIASSEFVVHTTNDPIVHYEFPRLVEEAPPVFEAPRPQPARVDTPPPPPAAEFDDVEAQVAALREAAADGAPFCEECERARLEQEAAAVEAPNDFSSHDEEAQVAALTNAAESGAPFCEECEKAKREQEAAAAEAPSDFASHDEAAQVAALTDAAESGAPFCEECEKAKQAAAEAEAAASETDVAAQSVAMISAAESGTPFCEECEKAKGNA